MIHFSLILMCFISLVTDDVVVAVLVVDSGGGFLTGLFVCWVSTDGVVSVSCVWERVDSMYFAY